jgi:hypothetical protein
MPTSARTPVLSLVFAGRPTHRHLLQAGPGATELLNRGGPLAVEVPAVVPPGTYDLEIRWGASCLVGRHCVAVGTLPTRVRIVHLSNMNVGDVGAPDFDARLIDEVNLVAPTLIVATGDYLDATHPDLARGWLQMTDFFAQFEAPAILACGDHDDIALYSRLIAPSPIGLVELGSCRGIVLLDHADNPLEQDSEQLRWVERVLSGAADDQLSFVISHAETPSLLRHWRGNGVLERMVTAARLGIWISGGHRDWDGQEWGELIAAAAPMLYLRTHQSSAAPREGAEGVSHYRVVDLTGVQAFQPGEVPATVPQPSIPVGRLSAALDGPNDGSRTQLRATVTNNLAYRMDGLSLRLLLRAEGDAEPWCHGARLVSAIRIGRVWECRLSFSLPDKGSLRAVTGVGAEPPHPDVEVRVGLPRQLRLVRQASAAGLSFLSASEPVGLVHVRNGGDQPVEVRPLIRLDGDRLSYRPAGEERPFATAYRLRLQSGEEVSLELDLSALKVRPGRRELQIYLKGWPAWAPVCHPLDVEVAQAESVARVDGRR